MADSFGKSQKNKNASPRGSLEAKYNNCVSNILVVVVFSLINIVLLVVNSNSYFLFSAFIPYFVADYGMFYSGSYPEEYYYDVPESELLDKSFLAVTLVIAAVILLIYLLCWFFARKKKVVWLYIALVLFLADTAAMFYISGFSADMIMDIVFHLWIVFYLINGIVNYNKLKKMPEEIAVTEDIMQREFAEIHKDTDVL